MGAIGLPYPFAGYVVVGMNRRNSLSLSHSVWKEARIDSDAGAGDTTTHGRRERRRPRGAICMGRSISGGRR